MRKRPIKYYKIQIKAPKNDFKEKILCGGKSYEIL
jgi:hypothetical protein